MKMNAERKWAVRQAQKLLVELDNVRKTFTCHGQKSWDVNPLMDLRFEQDRITEKLEKLREIADLPPDIFQKLAYAGVDFAKENPTDEKTGKLKHCYIKQHRNIAKESAAIC